MSLPRPKHEFRVTKYDPAKRAADGRFLGQEWYCFTQVQRGDVPLQECAEVEDRYIGAAQKMLRGDGVLSVDAISSNDPNAIPERIPLADIGERLRLCLREQEDERFQAETCFVHIGWDYYMYIGVNSFSSETAEEVERLGLFVEPFLSPYFPEDV